MIVRPNSAKAAGKPGAAKPGSPTAGVTPKGQKNSLMFRGESVFETAEKANEEAKSRGKFSASQRRFYLPPGKESEIIILDEKITAGAWEHDLPIPGKNYKNYVPCLAAVPGLSCPLCRAGDRRTYRMFATCLDLSQYTPKGGGKPVLFSKKLLAINQGEKERWQSIQQDTLELHGTMRGTYIYMKRPNEQRSSRIGEPFAVQGKLWQHMEEKDIVQAYGNKQVVEHGKIVKPANYDITAHNYDEIFPYPDEEFIAAMEAKYGNGVPQDTAADAEAGETARAGSASDVDQAWQEEIQEGAPEDEQAAAEAPDITGLGALADGNDQDAAQTLTGLCGEHGLNPEDFATWQEVEDTLLAATAEAEPEPEPEPVAKAKPVFTKGKPVLAKAKPVLAKAAPVPVAKPKPVFIRPGITRPVGIAKAVGKPGPVGKPGLVRPNRGAFGG